jgi:hypothetical protein
MNGEAEAWLEGAYPQLYGQWRQAYLKPAARQQDKAGDLCRICYIRQVTLLAVGTLSSNLAAFPANNLQKLAKLVKIKTFGFPRNIKNIFMKLSIGKRTKKSIKQKTPSSFLYLYKK